MHAAPLPKRPQSVQPISTTHIQNPRYHLSTPMIPNPLKHTIFIPIHTPRAESTLLSKLIRQNKIIVLDERISNQNIAAMLYATPVSYILTCDIAQISAHRASIDASLSALCSHGIQLSGNLNLSPIRPLVAEISSTKGAQQHRIPGYPTQIQL